MTEKRTIQKVTKLCIEELKNMPDMLASFINDIQIGKHKTWKCWKLHLGHVKCESYKGRPSPQRPNKSLGGTQMKFGTCYLAEKNGVQYTPQLQLYKCLNDKERAKMILASDCTAQVKADLLGGLSF